MPFVPASIIGTSSATASVSPDWGRTFLTTALAD